MLLELATQLIQQPSVTPNDCDCQKIIASLLKDNGFMIYQNKINATDNLLAIKGPEDKPLILFLGHTDVVPPGPGWKFDPFAAIIDDDNLHGRGAVDMKAAVAAMTIAAIESNNNNYRIGILLTSDEEGNGNDGIAKVIELWQPILGDIACCLVGEPTSEIQLGDTIKLGRRGSINACLRINGIQGHAAYPELASNPINMTSALIDKLSTQVWDSEPTGDFPQTTLVITGINSGQQTCNIIPAYTDMFFNIRYSPICQPEALKIQLTELLEELNLNYSWLSWQPNNGGPYKSKAGALTEKLISEIQNQLQITPKIKYNGGTSDGRFISKYCREVVEFGAKNNLAHKVDEHIAILDLEILKLIYQNCLKL